MGIIGFGVRRGREFCTLIDFILEFMTGVPIALAMPPVLYKSFDVVLGEYTYL